MPRPRHVALRYFNAAGADPDGELGELPVPETHLIPLVLFAAMGRTSSIKIFGNDYPTPDGTCIRDYVCSATIWMRMAAIEPRHAIEQSALVRKRLPQRMRQRGMALVVRAAGTRIWLRMLCAGGAKAVQAGLRHHDRPVAVPAARLSQHTHQLILNRIGHLHHDENEV